MEQIIRVSDDFAANYYPLEMSSDINWSGVKGCWKAELSIAEVPSEHIIVPSFSMIDADYSFCFEIQTPSGKCRLSNIPELKGEMKPEIFQSISPLISIVGTPHNISTKQSSSPSLHRERAQKLSSFARFALSANPSNPRLQNGRERSQCNPDITNAC